MKSLKALFLGAVFLSLIHCGGGTDQIVIPGVMTLSSEPGPAAQKLGVVEPEVIELETQLPVEAEEGPDYFILKILGFSANGEFPTDGPVRVELNPEGNNTGMIFKTDANGEPLGKSQINLDLTVEIADEKIPINGVQVGGFSETLDLEVEIAPIEYRNGSEETRVLKMPGLKKYTNIVFKRDKN